MQQNHIVFTAGNGQVYALVSVFFFPIQNKIEWKYLTRQPEVLKVCGYIKGVSISLHSLRLKVIEKQNIPEKCLSLTHTIFSLQYCISSQAFCLTADLKC